MSLELPHRKPAGPLALLRDGDLAGLVNGFVGWLFVLAGPVAVILTASRGAGLDERALLSWVAACYAVGGAATIVLSMLYRMPLVIMWTLPGAVLLPAAMARAGFGEVVGAYVVTALVIALLGLAGVVGRVMALLPLPIVMAMVAGVFLPFGVGAVHAAEDGPLIAAASLAGYVVAELVPALRRFCPPIPAALLAGAAVVAATGGLAPPAPPDVWLAAPVLYRPVFAPATLAELVLPLTVTVIAAQNAPGLAILRAQGYAPPTNTLTLACGYASVVNGLLGSVPACIAAPVTAIVNAGGRRERRYVGAVVFGVLCVALGVFAPLTVHVALAMPRAFTALIAGLAMLPILQGAFRAAFASEFRYGAAVSFVVTVSGLELAHIGSPFWALVLGLGASWLLERDAVRRVLADA